MSPEIDSDRSSGHLIFIILCYHSTGKHKKELENRATPCCDCLIPSASHCSSLVKGNTLPVIPVILPFLLQAREEDVDDRLIAQ